jgi:hypothetical protein
LFVSSTVQTHDVVLQIDIDIDIELMKHLNLTVVCLLGCSAAVLCNSDLETAQSCVAWMDDMSYFNYPSILERGEQPSPNKLTIVLDIDHTMWTVSRVPYKSWYPIWIQDANTVALASLRPDLFERLTIATMRPNLIDTLKRWHARYNLAVFTAGTFPYAEFTAAHLSQLTGLDLFEGRVFARNDMVEINDREVTKDIGKLGFDIKRTILLDDLEANFAAQRAPLAPECRELPTNGIKVDKWSRSRLASADSYTLDYMDQDLVVMEKLVDVRPFVLSLWLHFDRLRQTTRHRRLQ